MSDISTFIWAVLDNWAGYSTGGLIIAALALWFIWRDKPMPRKFALWLALLFLLMAFFKSWRDEHQKVEAFENERPYFALAQAGIRSVKEEDTGRKYCDVISVELRNSHPHPATEIHGRLLVLDEQLTLKPVLVQSLDRANDVATGAPLYCLSDCIEIPDQAKAAYVYCELEYRDAFEQNTSVLRQRWYFKFSGTKGGMFRSDLYDVSANEKARIDEYIKKTTPAQ
jgi:hypothetical protein